MQSAAALVGLGFLVATHEDLPAAIRRYELRAIAKVGFEQEAIGLVHDLEQMTPKEREPHTQIRKPDVACKRSDKTVRQGFIMQAVGCLLIL